MPIQYDPHPEYRAVFCAECGDEALVVHSSTPATSIEGKRQRCEVCGVEGKVVLLDDEDPSLCKLEFRAIVPEGDDDDSVRGGDRGPVPGG